MMVVKIIIEGVLLGIPLYFIFILVSTYVVNGARGFWPGFWQMFAILSIMNLIDRLFIDEYWVGHTKAWEIPGTEDLKPYINRKDKIGKWLMGTVGFAILSAILSGIHSADLYHTSGYRSRWRSGTRQ
ncbi:MAG: hypothetical protein J6P72_07895 [Firmicutes bacterium]|nr:hypothetical protein [Bacillota bacterium]